jgi:predicted DNA binding CopG/RHH family protein
LKQRGVTPATTIRLAPEDISRARTLAERRGLRYQTYLKMLIHEALEREERLAS